MASSYTGKTWFGDMRAEPWTKALAVLDRHKKAEREDRAEAIRLMAESAGLLKGDPFERLTVGEFRPADGSVLSNAMWTPVASELAEDDLTSLVVAGTW